MTDALHDCQGEGPEFVERAEIASLREQLTEARAAAIDECIQIVSSGVKWEPEEFYSDTHIKASNETAYLLAKALRSLKGETDD